ncbi:MAG: DNA integrity scanning protein DisA nucleotide-binding domain protein [Planctomycetes bacterium]|nr:DNA integrity scanning protein DisA nucleotide-binding domain protein [Planctomycetota bacterium]
MCELETPAAIAPGPYRVVWNDAVETNDRPAVSRALARHALNLADEVCAHALLMPARAVAEDEDLKRLMLASQKQIILVAGENTPAPAWCSQSPHVAWINVPEVPMTRGAQVKVGVLVALAQGLLSPTQRVVCLSGVDASRSMDACLVLNLETETELFSAADTVLLCSGVSPVVFERVLLLASQLATEGREGRPVGATFIIGDSDAVLAESRPLVLNPFHGYPESERNILDPKVEETIKEFSAIDGAFIIRGDGVVLAAGMQLVPTHSGPQLANGLGTRHATACAMTATCQAVAIVISQSTGTISIFRAGTLVTDIRRPLTGGRLA